MNIGIGNHGPSLGLQSVTTQSSRGKRGFFRMLSGLLRSKQQSSPRALVARGREVTFDGIPFVDTSGRDLKISRDQSTGRMRVATRNSRLRGTNREIVMSELRREMRLSSNKGVDQSIPDFKNMVQKHLTATRELRHGILTHSIKTPGQMLVKLENDDSKGVDPKQHAKDIATLMAAGNGAKQRGVRAGRIGAGNGTLGNNGINDTSVRVSSRRHPSTAARSRQVDADLSMEDVRNDLPHPLEKRVSRYAPPNASNATHVVKTMDEPVDVLEQANNILSGINNNQRKNGTNGKTNNQRAQAETKNVVGRISLRNSDTPLYPSSVELQGRDFARMQRSQMSEDDDLLANVKNGNGKTSSGRFAPRSSDLKEGVSRGFSDGSDGTAVKNTRSGRNGVTQARTNATTEMPAARSGATSRASRFQATDESSVQATTNRRNGNSHSRMATNRDVSQENGDINQRVATNRRTIGESENVNHSMATNRSADEENGNINQRVSTNSRTSEGSGNVNHRMATNPGTNGTNGNGVARSSMQTETLIPRTPRNSVHSMRDQETSLETESPRLPPQDGESRSSRIMPTAAELVRRNNSQRNPGLVPAENRTSPREVAPSTYRSEAVQPEPPQRQSLSSLRTLGFTLSDPGTLSDRESSFNEVMVANDNTTKSSASELPLSRNTNGANRTAQPVMQRAAADRNPETARPVNTTVTPEPAERGAEETNRKESLPQANERTARFKETVESNTAGQRQSANREVSRTQVQANRTAEQRQAPPVTFASVQASAKSMEDAGWRINTRNGRNDRGRRMGRVGRRNSDDAPLKGWKLGRNLSRGGDTTQVRSDDTSFKLPLSSEKENNGMVAKETPSDLTNTTRQVSDNQANNNHHAATPGSTPQTNAPTTTSASNSNAAVAQDAGSRGLQNLQEVLRQIDGQARLVMEDGGKRTMSIRMRPASLGALLVTIKQQDDKYTVQLRAEHPEAARIIESQLPQIREMLVNSGIQVDSFTVETGGSRDNLSGLSEKNGQGKEGRAQGRNESQGNEDQEEQTMSRRFVSLGTNTVDFIG